MRFCKKTISGKHLWTATVFGIEEYQMKIGISEASHMKTHVQHPQCRACGTIDDTITIRDHEFLP